MQKTFLLYVLAGFVGAVLMTESSAAAGSRPFVIAHRGASGYVPEHTLAGYFIAIQQGTDYVEPDLVITKDGALVARHENEIGGTTDVAMHPEFAARKTTKVIDGESMAGWFTEDFTLAELKTLRARERLPGLRKGNTRWDRAFEIPTFEEVLELVAAADAQRAADAREKGLPPPPRIGIYPETKHPSYFASLGLQFDARMLEALTRHGYTKRSDPICLQSFEVGNLKALRAKTDLPLVQLVAPDGRPADFTLAGDARTYADLMSDTGLKEIATYADAIGPNKLDVIPRDGRGRLGATTSLIAHAHAAGLEVHPWTFRAENAFLPTELRSGTDDRARGDLASELRAYAAAGVDDATPI